MKKIKFILFCIVSLIMLNQTGFAFGNIENDADLKSFAMATYAKFDGIDGESKVAGHRGWFKLLSVKHKKATVRQPLEIIDCTKELDTSSVDLGTAFKDKKQIAKGNGDPENPTWYMVDIRFKRKLKRVITLAELKAEPKLKNMQLVKKGNRLSVMPVTKAEFEHILSLA